MEAFDCIHGTWIPPKSDANSGYCRCDQGWSGPEHLQINGYCVYGPQNFIALYSWNNACNRACPWTFTNANPECGFTFNMDGYQCSWFP